MARGEAQDRKPGHWRTVDGRSLRAGELQAGIGTSQGEQRGSRRGWHDYPRPTGIPKAALASHPGTAVEWNLPATTGEASGNTETRRRGAKAWHPDGAGSPYPTGGDAGSARHVGPD